MSFLIMFFSQQHSKNLSLWRTSLITQMYAVCLLSRRLWAQWRTPPGPSAPRSLVQSQNGSKETSWEMGPESLRSETTSECCVFVCLSIQFRHHEAHSPLHWIYFSTDLTTGLMAWLSCTSSKYQMGKWLTKAASCPATATRPTRSTIALLYLSLGL